MTGKKLEVRYVLSAADSPDFLKGFLRGLRRLLIFETFPRALGKKLFFCPGENRNPVFANEGIVSAF